jgi:GxxExxY protein
MDTNGREYVENDLCYKVTGCAMAVLNDVGHGLREKTYERGLCVEFEEQGLAYNSQHGYPVIYKGKQIDEYIPDLEVEGRLIVETKVVESITDEHIGQVLNYLKITGMKVGIILNFKHAKLEWKKVVLTEDK